MQIEESKSNDFEVSPNGSGKGENDIRSRLRKNPNKTKFLYTDDLGEKKSKKKDILSPINIKETCRAILETIKKDPKSELFRQPAIKSFIDQKDKEYYKKKIKEPRDLGYIAKKLKTPTYSAKEFYDDLELCWSNALLFNDTDTEAYQCATYLKDLSDKLYKENNFTEIINKEKEKETNSNNNASSNANTNDSVNTPNKIQSKASNKNNNNKKDTNKNNKDNEKSERTDTISSNSNYSSKSKSKKKDNSDSSYSSEIKKNKLVGKKRKRQNMKEDKKKEDKNEEKNRNLENDKKSKKGRKKITKNANEESIQESIQTSNNKLTLDDIKNKYPINHQIISNLDDIEKITKKSKKSVKSKNGKKLSKAKKKTNNNHTNEFHNNKKKRKNSSTNNNDNSKNDTNHNININLLSKEDKKKVFYEIVCEIYNGKNPFGQNTSEDDNNTNANNNENKLFLYDPNKYQTESKELANYDKNCNTENVYNVVSLNPGKKQSPLDLGSKNNKGQNNNNDIKSVNSNNSGKDKKEDKNMQLRVEIAKYFDNLTDNNMIELLVYIENIRPQSIRLLENDTIYLDMEAFNDETFIKVFEFVKKHI
jgi:hypothetical protein